MFKRSLFMLILLCISLPAYAWQLQTRVATVGGQLAVDGGTAQTSVNGTVYKNYTDAVEPAVVVTAASGYKITSIYVNGAIVTPLPVSPASYTMGVVVYPAKTTQSVMAYFAKETYAMTTAAGIGGSVSPVGTSSVQFGVAKSVVFSPQTGKNVVAIDGLPTGATVTPAVPAALNAKVTVTFNMPAEPVNMTGKFVNLTASTDGPKTVLLTKAVTLNAASEPAGATFAWTQTGGPGFDPLNPITGSGAALTFTPAAVGKYYFRVVATSGANTATVNAYVVSTDDLVAAANSECNACHVSKGLSSDPFTQWSASVHVTDPNNVTCYDCHVGAGPNGEGGTPTGAACATCHPSASSEFYGSVHWQNNLEYGSEFEHQRNVTVDGATVTWDGTYTNGYLNANDSYETLEEGNQVTCAYRCHFRPGMGPDPTKKSTGGVSYTAPGGMVYTRPGGDSCSACHNAHQPETVAARNTCYTCHSGNNHGWSIRAFEKSTHFTGEHAKLYYQMDQKACIVCHNSHSTEATFGEGTAEGCQTCHQPGSLYGIYDATMAMVAPHGGGNAVSQAQYMFTGQTCHDCHSHNNTINAKYAESGHGDTLGVFGLHREVGTSCQRCHTTRGFVANLTGGTVTFAATDVQEVLACNACHDNVDKGTLRVPGAYTATWSQNSVTASVAFPNVGGSNLCVRCHSARRAGANITPLATTTAHYLPAAVVVFGGTTDLVTVTANTSAAPNDPAVGTKFTGGGYEFAGQTYAGLGYHKNVGIGNVFASGNNGPCVSCHMSGTAQHSWEPLVVDATTGDITAINSTVCANCHGDLTAAALNGSKQAFEDAANALDLALQAMGAYIAPNGSFYTAPYIPYVSPDPNPNVAANWSTIATATGLSRKDLQGAAYNLWLVKYDGADPASWVHNRAYALKLIADSLDYLSDGVVDGNGIPAEAAAAIANREFAEGTSHTASTINAPSEVNCGVCHAQAPHYAGSFGGNAQYMGNNATCSDCHASGNTTANVAILVQYNESAHGDVEGAAWKTSGSHDWPNATTCRDCHSTTGFTAKIGGTARSTVVAGAGQTLACDACHTDLAVDGAIRPAGQVTVVYKSQTLSGTTWTLAPATFPNATQSNLCINCHAGRESGESIKALTDASMVNVSFKNPHYIGAAGMMYAKLGYNFAGQDTVVPGTTTTYGKSLTANEDGGALTSTHRKLGTAAINGDSHNLAFFVPGNLDSDGPCVTCHMADSQNHTWEMGQNALDNVCNKCHAAEATDLAGLEFFLEEQAIPFQDAIALANANLLANFNIEYSDAYPYFYDKNLTPAAAVKDWTRGGTLSAAEAKQLMGACLNIKLMKAEPAAYVHARSYARRLLYDTIDWLDNKALDLSAGATALAWDPVKYVKDTTAGGTTTESTKYLLKYNRTTLAWDTLSERP